MAFRRVIWIVLDSVGIGEMPDAASSATAAATRWATSRGGARESAQPARAGLGNIELAGPPGPSPPAGSYGRCALASPGKDTTTGHWEMVGIHLDKPFPLYPHGFPREVMDEFERRIGRRTLGNKAASGTEIIEELGEEHMRTGSPIVYTSADSVFQIAAHEEVIPLWELYKICETAREILRGPHEVGRVIARPFIGEPGAFTRTANRHDYAVPPPKGMLLDQLEERGVPVYSVGQDLRRLPGPRHSRVRRRPRPTPTAWRRRWQAMDELDRGLIFVNLVDFDKLYGHRNDVEGYARALEEFDAWLPAVRCDAARRTICAILTADHGCDPTTPSTDHSREYVPLLAYGVCQAGVNLGSRATLSDIGQTVAENFETTIEHGSSFLAALAN